MNTPRTQTFTSKKQPPIDPDELARANREWQAQQNRLPCGVPVPPRFYPGMPIEQVWAWHRKLEAKIVAESYCIETGK